MGANITFQSNGTEISAYLATPALEAGLGVVVLQEWWGLVDHIRDVCDRFAAEGFTALAPDFYDGKVAKYPDQAEKLMMGLRIDEAEKNLEGATKFLLGFSPTNTSKVGTVGFCMGGALSLYGATKNANVGACVVFYGSHPNVNPNLKDLKSPVLGIYGERDKFVPPTVVHELDAKLRRLGKTFQYHIYRDAEHAFFNDTQPNVYNAEAAADAWTRTVAFLRNNLS